LRYAAGRRARAERHALIHTDRLKGRCGKTIHSRAGVDVVVPSAKRRAEVAPLVVLGTGDLAAWGVRGRRVDLRRALGHLVAGETVQPYAQRVLAGVPAKGRMLRSDLKAHPPARASEDRCAGSRWPLAPHDHPSARGGRMERILPAVGPGSR